jgi:hypothetical protein
VLAYRAEINECVAPESNNFAVGIEYQYDVSSVYGSISTDLINPGNAESLARTWSLMLVLDAGTSNPLWENFGIVPSLLALVTSGAC